MLASLTFGLKGYLWWANPMSETHRSTFPCCARTCVSCSAHNEVIVFVVFSGDFLERSWPAKTTIPTTRPGVECGMIFGQLGTAVSFYLPSLATSWFCAVRLSESSLLQFPYSSDRLWLLELLSPIISLWSQSSTGQFPMKDMGGSYDYYPLWSTWYLVIVGYYPLYPPIINH